MELLERMENLKSLKKIDWIKKKDIIRMHHNCYVILLPVPLPLYVPCTADLMHVCACVNVLMYLDTPGSGIANGSLGPGLTLEEGKRTKPH